MMTLEFETEYKSYYKRLHRIATRMLHDSDAAKDVVQDVFISYMSQKGNDKAIDDPKNWFIRSTVNKSVDYIRKSRRMVSGADVFWYDKSYQIDSQMDIIGLNSVLNKLSAKEQAIAVLYSEGYSYKEIADITGINFNSVGKTLARVLEKLRFEIDPAYRRRRIVVVASISSVSVVLLVWLFVNVFRSQTSPMPEHYYIDFVDVEEYDANKPLTEQNFTYLELSQNLDNHNNKK